MNVPILTHIGDTMIRIDGYYLYNIGAVLSPFSNLHEGATYVSMILQLMKAESELDKFISRSVFTLRASYVNAQTLC